MPIITPSERTAPVSTSQHTHQTSDSRREAAIAVLEGRQNTPNIAQDAPGQAIAPSGTPSTPDTQEASISQKNANGGDIDKRLADMARKEKQVWAELKKVKAEKEAIAKAQEGKLTKDEFLSQLRQDPTQLGLSYDELGQVYLNQGTPVDQQVKTMAARISELESKLSQAVTGAQEAQTAAYQQAIKQIDTEVKTLVNKSDAYEVTRSQGAEDAITKLIELTYQEEGILMDVEDAAAQVEAHLEQEALALFNKSQKLKAKLSPATPAPSAEETQLKQAQNPQTRPNTLTHGMVQASSKPMSRRDRAIAAFQGKLK